MPTCPASAGYGIAVVLTAVFMAAVLPDASAMTGQSRGDARGHPLSTVSPSDAGSGGLPPGFPFGDAPERPAASRERMFPVTCVRPVPAGLAGTVSESGRREGGGPAPAGPAAYVTASAVPPGEMPASTLPEADVPFHRHQQLRGLPPRHQLQPPRHLSPPGLNCCEDPGG